jgi:hypothetical protein
VWLDLAEMGVQGLAEVTRIGACPPSPEMPSGYGLVTARFRHRAEQVWALRLIESEEVIQGTVAHAFWSLDRQEGVSLSELRPSEQLSGLAGPVQVAAVTLVAEPQAVYNIEVEGEHCYRVGTQGLLVHNASTPCMPCTDPFSEGLQKSTTVIFKGQSVMRATGVVGAVIPPATVMSRVGESGMHQFQRGKRPNWWDDFEMANPTLPNDEWQRSHLLGSQLGGSGGSVWANMVPLHKDANKGIMVMCENRIAEYVLTCGDCVIYSATPVYSGDSLRPMHVLLEVVSKNKKANGSPVFRIRVRILNKVGAPSRIQCQAAGIPPECS